MSINHRMRKLPAREDFQLSFRTCEADGAAVAKGRAHGYINSEMNKEIEECNSLSSLNPITSLRHLTSSISIDPFELLPRWLLCCKSVQDAGRKDVILVTAISLASLNHNRNRNPSHRDSLRSRTSLPNPRSLISQPNQINLLSLHNLKLSIMSSTLR